VTRFLAMATVLLTLAVAPAQQPGTLPPVLLKDAARRGCTEVQEYYGRPTIDHAYAFGYLGASDSLTAVYWCQAEAGRPRYRLVVWIADSARAAKFHCARKISWDDPPHNLVILRDTTLLLRSLYSWGGGRWTGPRDARTQGPIIEDENYDGGSAYFYCHGSKWLWDHLD